MHEDVALIISIQAALHEQNRELPDEQYHHG